MQQNNRRLIGSGIVVIVLLLVACAVGTFGLSRLFDRNAEGDKVETNGGPTEVAEVESEKSVVIVPAEEVGESEDVSVEESTEASENDLSSQVTASNDSSYVQAYQDTLEYQVGDDIAVPDNLLDGFDPVPSLVMTEFDFPSGYEVRVPGIPVGMLDRAYECFPQDYSEGDAFNRGCQALQNAGQLPWSTPIAGYNDGENWSCDSPDGWCSDDIQAFNWRVETGYELYHPAVGHLKDPDGGAVMILFINFHDSDEIWGPRNKSAVYVDAGFQGYGVMWDLSGITYDVGEGISHLRNHWFYQLGYPIGNDNRYRGQCGDSGLCETVTYVVVARTWDRPEIGIEYSHFELLDYGQWQRS